MFLSLFGLAGGIGMPMQTSINAQLGKRVGSPFTAAMINFMVGWVALLIITAQTVGTGMAVVILLTGLMIGGLLVDQFGMFRSAKRPVGGKEVAGVAIMVIGATMFHLA